MRLAAWRARLGPVLLAGLAVCGGDGRDVPPTTFGSAAAAVAPAGEGDAVTVPERWISEADTAWNLDTPALWTDGREGRVVVTAKGAHDLQVFDAATGHRLGALGRPGTAPGAFRRPNAVLVSGDLAFVVERDNHRIQVLHMPDGRPSGTFGVDVLERPYGGVLAGELPQLTLWVTDDYDPATGRPPDLTHRVHRFRLRVGEDDLPVVVDHATFGEADGPGALAVVETIGLDPERGRVMVADETRKAYLVYDTTGAFTGTFLARGHVAGDPEGMALVRCPDGRGYWIVTDQQPDVSYFRLFRRGDLAYTGTFRGEATANTDGVTFAPAPVPGFGGGAFFAVDDDRAVSAFAWDDVAAALGLDGGCG